MPQTFTVGARSRFVDTVAWAFIALATVLCGLMLLWAGGALPVAARAYDPIAAVLPWLALLTAASVAMAVCAVGVVLRLDWARRLFIGLFAVWALVTLAGLWGQFGALRVLAQAVAGPASPGGPLLPLLVAGALGVASLLLCGVLAWVVRRLMSPMVRQEFA